VVAGDKVPAKGTLKQFAVIVLGGKGKPDFSLRRSIIDMNLPEMG